MKTKDFLIIALAPFPVLLIPLVGIFVSENWKWTLFDFIIAWVLLAGTTFTYRLLATRKAASLAWPADFHPGFARVFLLNFIFVIMFAGAGLLFRHAAFPGPPRRHRFHNALISPSPVVYRTTFPVTP